MYKIGDQVVVKCILDEWNPASRLTVGECGIIKNIDRSNLPYEVEFKYVIDKRKKWWYNEKEIVLNREYKLRRILNEIQNR